MDGRALPEPYVRVRRAAAPADGAGYFHWQRAYLPAGADTAAYRPTLDDWGPLVLSADAYPTLGDSRTESFDGRYTGFVEDGEITHRGGWIYFSRQPRTGPVRWSRMGRGIH